MAKIIQLSTKVSEEKKINAPINLNLFAAELKHLELELKQIDLLLQSTTDRHHKCQ